VQVTGARETTRGYQVKAEVCLRKVPSGFDFFVPVSLSPWAVAAGGNRVKATSKGSTFDETELTEGDCNAGWINFNTKGKKVSTIHYRNSLGENVHW
jgi:hypothetical protein